MACVKRGAVEIFLDYFVSPLGRLGDPTGQLFHVERPDGDIIESEDIIWSLYLPWRKKRESGCWYVPTLNLALVEVDRTGTDPTRRTGLKPSDLKP
jgi:hypothetical protein